MNPYYSCLRRIKRPPKIWTTNMVADLVCCCPTTVVKLISQFEFDIEYDPLGRRLLKPSQVNIIAAHFGVSDVARYLLGLEKG